VISYAIPEEGVLLVTFEDGKTDLTTLMRAFEMENVPMEGKPIYVK
jgi:hypothetical protein